nr:DUF1080 domain-containing protein [Lysobacter chinensis]
MTPEAAPMSEDRKHRRPADMITASIAGVLGAGALIGCSAAHPAATLEAAPRSAEHWPIHSTDRPQPATVEPGPAAAPAPVPVDAEVLFDGSDLSRWRSAEGGPARWKVEDGHLEVAPGAGAIVSSRGFGDVQLHVEWMAPEPATGRGQDRGNSGVFLMGRYEVQILDSYRNTTYPDGQAGAIYGQFPPRVNASRPPGEWQQYDIVFRAPRFDAEGRLQEPARMTVRHNGVLVQDGAVLTGPTAHRERPPYAAHPPRLPLLLQDHGSPVRFRNIWLRELD